MNADISLVNYLREIERWGSQGHDVCRICGRAADEIERLGSVLADVAAAIAQATGGQS